MTPKDIKNVAKKTGHLSEPRIPPLEESEWDDDAKSLIEGWQKMNNYKYPVPNVMRTMCNYSKLYNRWRVFGNHILFKSSLPLREKEIMILRIGWLCQSEYEWAQHTVIGKRAGLTDEEIQRIIQGPDAEGWNSFESMLVRAVDELYTDTFIRDDTWNALSEHYDRHQMMDLVFTVGQYNLVSMMLNTFGIQLEKGMKGFPE